MIRWPPDFFSKVLTRNGSFLSGLVGKRRLHHLMILLEMGGPTKSRDVEKNLAAWLPVSDPASCLMFPLSHDEHLSAAH